MLTTLCSWIYITFLCWTWGILFLKLLNRITKKPIHFPHFSIICITGLSLITIVAATLSLIIPLGNWWVQFFFILPCLLFFFQKNDPYFFASLKKQFTGRHITSLIMLPACLLLILVMSSWTIVHPDTLGYHAQTMQWIEKYKAVPGLVHLHVRLGYQGFWFIDCALFDLAFSGKQGITFLNSAVLSWYFIFIINRIDHNFFKEGKKIYGLLWLGLLTLTLWSYTQVRLTATSASPDFIAALFILAIIYLFLHKRSIHLDGVDWLLAALLSIVAVTIKLSAAPILLVAVAAALFLFSAKTFKLFFVLLSITIITCSVFITRNIITSGYIIFPSATVDVTNVDWKYSKALTINEKNYITAYAKKQGVVTKQEIDAVNKMSIDEWIPVWWQNRSAADKTTLVLLMVSLVIAILFAAKFIKAGFITLVVQLTMVIGLVFWFINAPDPRFGFGFILGLISIVAYVLSAEKELPVGKNALKTILVVSSLLVFAYTVYRFKNFFRPEQLVFPLGIEKSEYKTFDCDGIPINSPVNEEFGITPVPCTDLDCRHFSPRGSAITDGFRAK